jgi:hypothetical protein
MPAAQPSGRPISGTPDTPTKPAKKSSLSAAPHPQLVTDITVEHGPVDLLGRLFLKADTAARRRGVTVSFGTFEELAEVNKKNRETWGTLTTMYDYRFCPKGLAPERAFCLLGRDVRGEVVATQAGRIFFLDEETLYDTATSLRMFYDDPDSMKATGERCEVTATVASTMRGVLLINGAVWYHPAYRKRQLSTIIPRISRAYALTRWEIDHSMGLMMEGPTKGGVINSLGYPHREYDLRLIDAPNGSPRCCLAWMHAGELLEDLGQFLVGFDAEVDAGVDQGYAQKQG